MSGSADGDGREAAHRPAEPDWVTHAIWWQVYPLGFTGAPISRDAQAAESVAEELGSESTGAAPHSLERLVGWLDYAVELGASGILLGPVFASETHGYDTIDYLRIDPRLGGDKAFDVLVAEAHARGLRLVLDGVFNHVGRGFEPFQQALAGGASVPEFSWFRPIGEAPPDPREQRFENFEGHDSLVALNHDEPQVADYVVSVMNRWLARGADGWRLDAAYAVPPAFWAEVMPRVRHEHPEVYVFGEVIHGDYSAIVSESTLDSLTQYEVWKAVWSSISDGNFFELSAALDRHNGYLDHFVPVTFIGNHDVTRLASAVADPRHREHALVILMTIGGTPIVYYGDEQGFAGVKEEREGGDDAIRPQFGSSGPSSLPAEGWAVYHLHQNLIGFRRRHPWLHSARSTTLALTNEFFAYEVGEPGGESLVVLLNLGDDEYTHQLSDARQLSGTHQLSGYVAIVSGTAGIADDRDTTSAAAQPVASVRVTVPGHGWAVVRRS